MNNNNHNNAPIILIVEDNQDYLNYLARLLVENGYEIAAARDKKAALDFLETSHIGRIDLVLLDISLSSEGDNEGFDVCKQYKQSEKAKHIPIIFLSHHDGEDHILQGFNEGGVDYISKKSGAKNEKEMLARVKTHVELKQSRDTIDKQVKELKELNATKDKFFRIIGHDLRGVFQSVLGNSKFLEINYKKLDEEKKLERIKKINTSSSRIYRLFENLLEWANIQLKGMKPQMNQFDLNPIIQKNISLYDATAKDKDIRVHNQVISPCNVFADTAMMDCVIRNLIHNAVKYTGNGGNIDARSIDRDEYIEISISDTGMGIPDECIDILFCIDHSCSTPGTDGEKGTGLGLILCKEFLSANGGEIRVESKMGKGSTFIIKLRKKPVEEDALSLPLPGRKEKKIMEEPQ